MRPGDRGPHREPHIGPAGIRTWRCPRRWADEPIARKALGWYRWWKEGALHHRYAPHPVPAIVVEAVDVLDGAISATRESLRPPDGGG